MQTVSHRFYFLFSFILYFWLFKTMCEIFPLYHNWCVLVLLKPQDQSNSTFPLNPVHGQEQPVVLVWFLFVSLRMCLCLCIPNAFFLFPVDEYSEGPQEIRVWFISVIVGNVSPSSSLINSFKLTCNLCACFFRMKLCHGGENKKTRKKKRKEQGILLLLHTSVNHILCFFFPRTRWT